MKTKKEILQWWEEKGGEENALQDFYDNIEDDKILIECKERIVGDTYFLDVTLSSTRWKYPLILVFEQKSGICVHIRGF